MPPVRIISLIVATALFMESMDATVIATSLPAIAADIGASPLALKLAVTSYLLSLAVFIPASGWIADRFGARTVFRAAIAVFVLGSIGCAISNSLTDFVAARILQGIGGAMMTPVGRLVLVRTIPKRELIDAMSWVAIPALVGPVVGPPLGGFITTYATWHWIFLINVPIGLLGIVMASRYIEDIRAEERDPFDFVGLLLSGLGIAGLSFGFSVLGLDMLPLPLVLAMIAAGAAFTVAYVFHARRTPAPVLDLTLFRLPTFRASVAGGFLFRLGIGALPFLLPLMLQLGFHMTPLESGLITFASAIGAMGMKAVVPRIIKRFGFRRMLMINALLSAAFLAACAAFSPQTPVAVMFTTLLIGGFARSAQFTAINTIAYADIETRRMSRATSLSAVGQQLALASGVAVGALAVELTLHFKGSTVISAADFMPAFLVVGLISASSFLIFAQLSEDAGAELAQRVPTPAPTEPGDDRIG